MSEWIVIYGSGMRGTLGFGTTQAVSRSSNKSPVASNDNANDKIEQNENNVLNGVINKICFKNKSKIQLCSNNNRLNC